MASEVIYFEFEDIRTLDDLLHPLVIQKLADIIDESGTYGTWGAFHFVLWVRNRLMRESDPEDGAVFKWERACLPIGAAPEPGPESFNYTKYIVPEVQKRNNLVEEKPLCKAAAQRLDEIVLPAITQEEHP